ncbi:hypothetical protein PENSPDRAFT_750183 [Peniophora sp. CONT]|nr:hypothetical protein PENSPDRAFT_750183 [Peniophora sp. CONT]
MSDHVVNLNAILPVEVLSAILVDHIVDDPDFASVPHGYLAELSISISHVCQLWRSIAFSPVGKRLWTHAPLRHKAAACVDAFMQRSHPLPIFLKIEIINTRLTVKVSPALSAVESAFKYSSRVATISLSFAFDHVRHDVDEHTKYERILELLDNHPFPSLEFLYWYAWADYAGHFPSSTLFALQPVRSLRRSYLRNIHVGWPNPLLSAPLTTLVLDISGGWQTFDTYPTALSSMPTLETLSTNRIGFLETLPGWSSEHQLRSISLPRLKRLALSDTLTTVAMLFAYLHVPVDCQIDMDVRVNGLETASARYWDRWHRISLSLRAQYGSASFSRLVVSGEGHGDDDIRFSLYATSPMLPTLDLAFFFTYQDAADENCRCMRTLRVLLENPFLSQITSLVAQDVHLFSPKLDGLIPPPKFLSTVKHLTATRFASQDTIYALARHPAYTFLPALRHLELREAVFCKSDLQATEPVFDALIGAVAARKHLSTERDIEYVTFDSCGVTQMALDMLRDGTSAEVNWDGQYKTSDEIKAMKRSYRPPGSSLRWQIISEAMIP